MTPKMVKKSQNKHLWLFFSQSEKNRPVEAVPYLKNCNLRSTNNIVFTFCLDFLTQPKATRALIYVYQSQFSFLKL